VHVTHTVMVQAGPSVNALTYKRHLKFQAIETWVDHSVNTSTFSLNATLTVVVYDESGTLVGAIQTTMLVSPNSAFKLPASFAPTLPGTYTFTATMTYQATIPLGVDGFATTVFGSDGSVTGSFTAR